MAARILGPRHFRRCDFGVSGANAVIRLRGCHAADACTHSPCSDGLWPGRLFWFRTFADIARDTATLGGASRWLVRGPATRVRRHYCAKSREWRLKYLVATHRSGVRTNLPNDAVRRQPEQWSGVSPSAPSAADRLSGMRLCGYLRVTFGGHPLPNAEQRSRARGRRCPRCTCGHPAGEHPADVQSARRTPPQGRAA